MNAQHSRWRSILRFASPIVLIVASVMVLTGCFFVPWPEHRRDKNQPDFRDMVGDSNSNRPIRTGAITRSQVLRLLGDPPYASADDRAVAYSLNTESGAWVYPLCFSAEPAAEDIYVLRLEYDEHDVVAKWDIVHDSIRTLFNLNGYVYPQPLIDKLNKSGPKLEPATCPATRESLGL
jgi:hypothetical protein